MVEAPREAATKSRPSDPGEMGYADHMRFEPGELGLLAETEEIEIETAGADGSSHRTIIWVVVDGDDAFIRSYRGPGARWYREALADPSVKVHVDGRALDATVISAADPASVERTSAALSRKYPNDPGTPGMLKEENWPTTLRLEPA
jgi:hypothetical protein